MAGTMMITRAMKSMATGVALWFALAGTGCGYMDQDLDLSDESFAASLEGEAGSQTITLGAMSITGGCGVGGRGYGGGYRSHGVVVRRHGVGSITRVEQGAGTPRGALLAGGVGGGVEEEEGEIEQEERELTPAEVFALNHELVEATAAAR